MLGEEQWKWLEEQLRLPAEIRLIVSSIQVVPEDHHWETWANLPLERQRLFQLIRTTGAEGVLFLSGDRHLGELSMMDGGVGYPLFDLTSSGLNVAHHEKWRKQEPNRHRVATMNLGDNFGVVEIDWERADPRISLQIRDVDGDIAIQRKIPLSLLKPGVIRTAGQP
jgi:alkaline phosphatase D